MDDELADAVNTLAGTEPERATDAFAHVDPHDLDDVIDRLDTVDTPAARRLRRALKDWRQSLGRLQRAAQHFDRAQQDVREAAREVCAE